jgi:hypothetical protein
VEALKFIALLYGIAPGQATTSIMVRRVFVKCGRTRELQSVLRTASHGGELKVSCVTISQDVARPPRSPAVQLRFIERLAPCRHLHKEPFMKLSNFKAVAAAAVVFGGLAAASAAHARADVVFSIGLPVPYGYLQPAPVYVQPAPVYVQPQSFHVQPAPVYYTPHHSHHGRGAWGDGDRDHYRRGAWGDADRDHYRRGAWGDADRDGVPNRFDRSPHNPYRR